MKHTHTHTHTHPHTPATAVARVIALVLPGARARHLLLIARGAFSWGGFGGWCVVGPPSRAARLGEVEESSSYLQVLGRPAQCVCVCVCVCVRVLVSQNETACQ